MKGLFENLGVALKFAVQEQKRQEEALKKINDKMSTRWGAEMENIESEGSDEDGTIEDFSSESDVEEIKVEQRDQPEDLKKSVNVENVDDSVLKNFKHSSGGKNDD